MSQGQSDQTGNRYCMPRPATVIDHNHPLFEGNLLHMALRNPNEIREPIQPHHALKMGIGIGFFSFIIAYTSQITSLYLRHHSV